MVALDYREPGWPTDMPDAPYQVSSQEYLSEPCVSVSVLCLCLCLCVCVCVSVAVCVNVFCDV